MRPIANALPLAQQPATETLAPFTSIYLQCANASSLYRSGCATIVTIKLRGETCMRGTLSAQLSVLRRCPCSPAARAGQRCPPSDAPRRPQLNRELRSPGLLYPCDGGAW